MAVKWLAHLLVQNRNYKHMSVKELSDKIDETLENAEKINTNFAWSIIDRVLRDHKILPDPVWEEDNEGEEGEEVERIPGWDEVCDDVYCYGWDQNDNTVYLKELFQKEVELRPFSEYKEWL